MEVDESSEVEQSSLCSSEGDACAASSSTKGSSRNAHSEKDMPSWCSDPRYDRYWKHRRQVEQWFRRHSDAQSAPHHSWPQHSALPRDTQSSSSLTQYYYSSMLYWQQRYYQLLSRAHHVDSGLDNNGQYRMSHDHHGYDSSHACSVSSADINRNFRNHNRMRQSSCSSTEPRPSSGKRGKRVKKKGQGHSTVKAKQARTGECCDHGNDLIFDVDPKLLQGSQDEEVVECHMQITDEMLEFFAKSAIHRRERDEKKKQQEDRVNAAENVFIDISKADKGTATTEAPRVRPGQKRTAEMKELYGNGAAMIHGMETAMQLNFDRNLDLKQPKHWPHLPLNIRFK